MVRIKVSRNFYLDEFVPPEIYHKYGDKSIWFIDQKIITLAQFCRDFWGVPISINTWATGGRFKWSGYRTPDCTIGAKYSQHKSGRAIDIHLKGKKYKDLRNDIRNNWEQFKEAGLTTIEKGTKTWLHLDVRNTQREDLYEVPYYGKK